MEWYFWLIIAGIVIAVLWPKLAPMFQRSPQAPSTPASLVGAAVMLHGYFSDKRDTKACEACDAMLNKLADGMVEEWKAGSR